MILCDRETRAAMERGDIGITPFPEEPARWSPTTVDLTLDTEIRPWEPIARVGEDAPVDPASPDFNINALIDRHTTPRDCSAGFLLAPGRLVLGWTLQKIRLPHRARIGAPSRVRAAWRASGLAFTSPPRRSIPALASTAADPTTPAARSVWKSGTSARCTSV